MKIAFLTLQSILHCYVEEIPGIGVSVNDLNEGFDLFQFDQPGSNICERICPKLCMNHRDLYISLWHDGMNILYTLLDAGLACVFPKPYPFLKYLRVKTGS
jgi:hypothetical protein